MEPWRRYGQPREKDTPLANMPRPLFLQVEVNGLVCAGKKIHELLLDAGNVGVREIATRYVQECQLMSDLRHPNITQFMGVCFLPNCQLPLLVMERLDTSLDELLESVANIHLALKRSFLEDVAKAPPNQILVSHPPQAQNPCGRAGFLAVMVVNVTGLVGNGRQEIEH